MASSSEEHDFSGVFDDNFDFSELDLSDDDDWGSVDVAEKDDEEKVPKRTKRRDLSYLEQHMTTNESNDAVIVKTFTCDVCSKVFKTKPSCKNHLLKGHELEDPKSERCSSPQHTGNNKSKKRTVKVRPTFNYSKQDALEDSVFLLKKALTNVMNKPIIKTGRNILGVPSVIQMVSKLQDMTLSSPDKANLCMQHIIDILWPAITAGDKGFLGCAHRETIYKSYHEIRTSGKLHQAMRSMCAEAEVKSSTMNRDCSVVSNVIFETLLLRREECDTPHEEENSAVVMDKVEENVLRYACGYIPMALTKQLRKRGPSVSPLIDCLSGMRCTTELSDSFLSYTTEWVDKENRGGLHVVNDKSYIFFRTVESIFRKKFRVDIANIRDSVIDDVLADRLALSRWAVLASCLNENQSIALLSMCVKLWVNIRCHSMAKRIIQQHKVKTGISQCGNKGLRKGLKEISG
ncbi:uncharacterized protein LOC144452208 [Glandiceps talaboti]